MQTTEPAAIIKRLSNGLPSRYGLGGLGVGRTAAADASQERKVRAPQGRVVDNIDRPKGSGKCNRKQTAAAGTSPRLTAAAARVKRCGKSAPAAGATRLAWQTPPGARPSRAHALGNECAGRPGLKWRSGRLLEAPGNRRPREMAVTRARPFGRRANRTRLTGPLRDQLFAKWHAPWFA